MLFFTNELVFVGTKVAESWPSNWSALRLATLPVELTAKEFDMLYLLAQHPKQVFTREQLLERIWGGAQYIDPGTVTVHVRRLREKIELDPSHPARLLTVWGVGYKFEP